MTHAYHVSFEFFPPKTVDNLNALKKTAADLLVAHPQFCSVTFGAGGSTREGTLETVKMLKAMQVDIAPHLACVGLTRSDILQILHTYRSLGIQRMVAIRGDLPSGMGQTGELKYAHELVALIRKTMPDDFQIEVAAYPEVHPQAKNAATDLENLKQKVRNGANSAITQYFFNVDAYFYFVDLCAKNDIHIPIIPGIMPITNVSKLVRFSELCGAEIPRWLQQRLVMIEEDSAAVHAFGLELVHTMCERLIKGGAPGLHFYTLNQSGTSLKLLEALN